MKQTKEPISSCDKCDTDYFSHSKHFCKSEASETKEQQTSKPREVWVNMRLGKNEVTAWKDNPVGFILYPVTTTINISPSNSVLFREVLPDDAGFDANEKLLAEAIEVIRHYATRHHWYPGSENEIRDLIGGSDIDFDDMIAGKRAREFLKRLEGDDV